MPVVNRKYQIGDSFVSKNPNGFKDIHRIISLTKCPDRPYIFKGDDSLYGYWESEKYIDEYYDWRGFEELPEDNLQETEKATIIFQNPDKPSLGFNSSTWSDVGTDSVDLKNGEANKIEMVLEELEETISKSLGKITCVNDVNKITSKLMDVIKKAQNLVNALEVSNLKPKIDIKKECVDPVNLRKETYRCAHDYVLKNQGYNNSDHLITEYECSICGENKMTIQS